MLNERQLKNIIEGLPKRYKKVAPSILMDVAKKAAKDAEENYKKLPEPKTRSLFFYIYFWVKNAITFDEYNFNLEKLIREQEEASKEYKNVLKNHFEAQAKYFENVLPGSDINDIRNEKTPNTEDLWRKIDERIVFDTEEEILKDCLPLFNKLIPKYVRNVNTTNDFARARGYKSGLDVIIREKEIRSFTKNKEKIIKYCQKQIPNTKLPSWFYSQFNRTQNFNFIKLLLNLSDVELPDGILDIASREYPILAIFINKIQFELDCRDSCAYYEKKTDTFKIIINKNKDRWERTVELFNSIAKVVGDLVMFEAYRDSESLIKKKDVLEFSSYWIEFKLLKQFSLDAYQARISNILFDITDVNFLLEVYKNPDQDLPKLYAEAFNHCFPDAKQTQNYTYLIRDDLSFHPFGKLSQVLAQVKVLAAST